MAENQVGTLLSCTNEICECRVRVEVPCPHGDQYTCACGHAFVPFEGTQPLTDVPA